MPEPEPSYRLLPFAALHERMRSGDAAAADEFYRRYEPFMRSVARYWLSPQLRRHADSGDMVQSVFRIALQNADAVSFADEAKVKSWLGRVMRGRVARVARRVKGPGGRAIEDVAAHDDDLDGVARPEAVAEHAELVHLLKASLEALPEDERKVIRLREFEGREYSEVASQMGRPTSEAARKLHERAVARLAKLMGANGPGRGAP